MLLEITIAMANLLVPIVLDKLLVCKFTNCLFGRNIITSPAKYSYVSFKSNLVTSYYILDTLVTFTHVQKDLGTLISSDFSWN